MSCVLEDVEKDLQGLKVKRWRQKLNDTKVNLGFYSA
jgi:hypothetical protein